MKSTLNRSVIASGASVIGAFALVIAGLLFLVNGNASAWVFGCIVIGVASISLWMWWSPDEFRAWMTGRQARLGTTSILVTILFIGFLSYVYVLVDRANITADFTEIQRYTLNKPTLDTIARLRERGYRVRIVGFFSRRVLREQESADLLLRQYEAEGHGAIEVEYVDPDANPDLAKLYGYQSGYDGNLFLLVLGSDGKPEMVRNADNQLVFKYAPQYLGDVNERNITTGLMTVAAAGQFKIYFTTGHAELSLDQIDDMGISRLAASLIDQGIGAEPLNLLDVLDTGIPEDASAVLIVGPRMSFSDAEVQVIADYIRRGGRVGIFADPPIIDTLPGVIPTNAFLREGSPFSNYLWNEFGVRVRDEIVIESKSSFGSEFNLIVDHIAPHTIMQGVEDAAIIMEMVRPIEITTQPEGDQMQYKVEPLLYSSDHSYGESDIEKMITDAQTQFDEQSDSKGPLLLGVTIRHTVESQSDIQPRVVIIGDSDVLRNELVSQYPGNVYLWSDIVNWLTGFSQEVSFSAVNDTSLLPLVVTDAQRRTISYITLLIMPGAVLVSGTIVWWYRRR